MEVSTSPPSTPLRNSLSMSPIDTGSPVHSPSYREHLRRRTSSFSSTPDRSPVSVRSKHRFSNASQYSDNFSPDGGGGGGGMGNLADELDDLDDEGEYEEEVTESQIQDGQGDEPSPIDGARDSGIDVSYSSSSKKGSPRSTKNFSKPFCALNEDKAAEEEEHAEDKLSPELEDALSSIARMASTTPTNPDDPLIPRVVALLQDLGNQGALEAGAQRLNTSTNSMASHLASQSKALQTLATTFYSPFAFTGDAALDPTSIDETLPFIAALLADLPHPDTAPLTGLQKLSRETDNVLQTLSQLADTLQMGKQTTNAAARHLRTTETMVAELRRERERAENARWELDRGPWEKRVRERWCKGQCDDVVAGFERRCEELRGQLEVAGQA